MLDVISNDRTDEPDITKIWPADPVTGRLVIVGPSDDDGKPYDLSCLQAMGTETFWVGFVHVGSIENIIRTLQPGNPRRLTVYGMAKASQAEVRELQNVLSNDRLHGNWFSLWAPLIEVINILRGD